MQVWQHSRITTLISYQAVAHFIARASHQEGYRYRDEAKIRGKTEDGKALQLPRQGGFYTYIWRDEATSTSGIRDEIPEIFARPTPPWKLVTCWLTCLLCLFLILSLSFPTLLVSVSHFCISSLSLHRFSSPLFFFFYIFLITRFCAVKLFVFVTWFIIHCWSFFLIEFKSGDKFILLLFFFLFKSCPA